MKQNQRKIKKHQKASYSRIRFGIGLALFIIFFVACDSPKQYREEPYTVMEQQDITLTYLVEGKEMHYQRTDGAILFGDNPKIKAYCRITNTTEHPGTFKFYATLSSQGNSVDFEDEKYLQAGETELLSDEKEINPFSFETNVEVDSWGIVAPTVSVKIAVTKYRKVEY